MKKREKSSTYLEGWGGQIDLEGEKPTTDLDGEWKSSTYLQRGKSSTLLFHGLIKNIMTCQVNQVANFKQVTLD